MFSISNRTYDVLKWVTTIFLPAFAVLYVALADVWGLPYSVQVAATVTAMVLFLGAVLQISTAVYNANTSMFVEANEELEGVLDVQKGSLRLSPAAYDTLRFISQIVLPALAALYLGVATIWNLGYGEQVSATILAITLYMNAVLGVSSKVRAYYFKTLTTLS